MGSCYNCGSQLTLSKDETKCDKCGSILKYYCNSCAVPFYVTNEEGQKRAECGVCGDFYCPNCGSHKKECELYVWSAIIKKIIEDESKNKYIKLKEIMEYIAEIKINRPQKICMLGVPRSYAKGSTDNNMTCRIKKLVARLEGHNIKSLTDRKKFRERLDEIFKLETETTVTVEGIRAEGEYGQEYRDVLNFAVCLGKMEVTHTTNKKGKDVVIFKKVDKEACQYYNQEQVTFKRCGSCNKEFNELELEYCPNKKHKKLIKLKHKIKNIDICQLDRKKFINKKDE